jgi:hypothetical protein
MKWRVADYVAIVIGAGQNVGHKLSIDFPATREYQVRTLVRIVQCPSEDLKHSPSEYK